MHSKVFPWKTQGELYKEPTSSKGKCQSQHSHQTLDQNSIAAVAVAYSPDCLQVYQSTRPHPSRTKFTFQSATILSVLTRFTPTLHQFPSSKKLIFIPYCHFDIFDMSSNEHSGTSSTNSQNISDKQKTPIKPIDRIDSGSTKGIPTFFSSLFISSILTFFIHFLFY